MTSVEEKKVETVKFTIDGREITVPKGTTVYSATQALGIEIPIYCYHDRMPPFGACRVCLVEVEKFPKPQTSCTLEAQEGMVVKTQSSMAVKGREDILELLLINHPLDCPICDRGGECPLQDFAYEFGPEKSRFYEEKRHFKKPIPLGPVLMLDRERCIACARCTRFGDLVAGDHALEFIDRGFRTEVGTPDGEPVKSKFIGNTIKICPVGALTSQVYRFRARPWDNLPTPSTCTLCPVGCSLYLDSRDGEIMRTRSREDKEVNDIWMCDKGWFGYEFTDSPERITTPLVRRGGKLEEASWDEALSRVAIAFEKGKHTGKMAGWGGYPLTIEENYLFQALFRQGAGVNNLDYRVGMPIINLTDEVLSPGMEIAVGDCHHVKHTYLLGFNVTEEFPVLWLQLKEALNHGGTLTYSGYFAPEISSHLTQSVIHGFGQELETVEKLLKDLAPEKTAIFIGSQYLNSPLRGQLLDLLKKVKETHPEVSVNIMEGKGNSMGARFAGMHPELDPGGKKSSSAGLSILDLFNQAKSGWDYLHVAGGDPASQYPTPLWKELRSHLQFLVVQDLFLTETAKSADIVLPTYSYSEKRGSFLTIAGNIQKINPGKALPEGPLSDQEIFMRLAEKLHLPLAIERTFLEKLHHKKIDKTFYPSTQSPSQESLKGDLQAVFEQILFDDGVRMQHNPHAEKLAAPPKVHLHPEEGKKRNVQCGDEVQIEANGISINAHIKLDKGVATGIAVIPLRFSELHAQQWGPKLTNGLPLKIRKS